ncbi:MAG: ABC transporter permease [Sulfuriferula sp.]|nr:ABC transporter permease [Sulfuriferula sp.]
MMPVVLWTDALIYLLVISMALMLYFQPADGQLREALRRLYQNKMGIITGWILLMFTLLALLDSLHYRPVLPDSPTPQYSIEVMSALDAVLQPLRAHNEKTYSAPLAQHLYVKENVTLANGLVVRDYPRLNIAQTPQPEVSVLLLRGTSWGMAAILLIWLVMRLFHVRHTMGAGSWVLIIVLLGTMLLISLAGHYHILGTDKVGQDVLYSTLKSIRTGLLIGTLTTLIMLPFAVLMGISAGYFGGWLDDVIQYIYTTLNAIPSVLLIAAAVLMMQVYIETHPALFDSSAARTDFRLLFLCIIIGVTNWTGLCRLLRGETLKLRELDYVQAARAFAVSDMRIMLRHILPNLFHLILISVVMDFSGLVLAEAVLSYVGVGVDPAMQSWGNMINAARLEMAREPVVWWPLVAAFSFMFTLVLAANLFADSVRDAFDPKGHA